MHPYIDDIIDRLATATDGRKGYQPGGLTVYVVKRGTWYDVVITNKNNYIVPCIGGSPDSLDSWKAVLKMLDNYGGFWSLPQL